MPTHPSVRIAPRGGRPHGRDRRGRGADAPQPVPPRRRVAEPAGAHERRPVGRDHRRRPRRGREHLGLPPLLQQPAAGRGHLRGAGRRPAGGEVQPRRRAPRQLGRRGVRGPARLPRRPRGQLLGDRTTTGARRCSAWTAGGRGHQVFKFSPDRRDPDDAGQRRASRATGRTPSTGRPTWRSTPTATSSSPTATGRTTGW